MNAKLLVVVGKTTKREVDLQLPAVLGRSREADVTVAHPLISRRHCEISEDNGVLVLRDLGSLNGTMIGGRRIEFSALMPEAEFAIGPLTFRVLYDYDGDLESVPETRFLDVVEGPTDADGGQAVSADSGGEATHFVEAPPTEAAQESISGELAMPDLLALADAEIEELVPPAPPVPSPATRPRPATQSTGQFSRVAAPGSPALADVKLPTMRRPDGLDEPLDVDSSLQSGSHESPWGAEPPAVEKSPPITSTRRPQPASAGDGETAQPETPPEVPPVGEVSKPPDKGALPTSPPKRPPTGDEMDPEFGNFLEGLE